MNVLTKSELVLRNWDIFVGRRVNLGVTIAVPDEQQARLWEPHASTVAARLHILKDSKRAGMRTALMLAPLLPEISDSTGSLRRSFELAKEADVDCIHTDALNPRPRAKLKAAVTVSREVTSLEITSTSGRTEAG